MAPDAASTDPQPTDNPPLGADSIELQLRWGDMDANAHVNNVQFVRLLEEARVRAAVRWFRSSNSRMPLLVVRQTIDYKASLEYSTDPIVVRVGIARIGTTSYTMASTVIAPDGTVCAISEATMVVIDSETGRPRPIPDFARAVLEARRSDVADMLASPRGGE